MLIQRFLLKYAAAFILVASAFVSPIDLGTHGQHAPVPLPARTLAIRMIRVRFELASRRKHLAARTQPVYRPVDSTLLHDLSVSSDGAIWIAPLFNGFQWGGTYERAVRFDPRTNATTSYKIARMQPAPTLVAPAEKGSAWARDGLLVGHYSATGALTQTVPPDLAAQPGSLAVNKEGDLWVAEPNRAALGRIDLQTGVWNEAYLPLRIGVIGDLAIDPSDDVWFATTDYTRIGRYSPATRKLKVFHLPASTGRLVTVSTSDDRGVWFIDDKGTLGYLASATGHASVWGVPGGPATSMAALAHGALVIAQGSLLDFDMASDRFTRLVLPSGFTPEEAVNDGHGEAWIAGQKSIAHADARAVQATIYNVTGINPAMDPLVGQDGRACFPVNGGAACLREDGVLTTYKPAFVPGLIGVAQGEHAIWFAERGRLTCVDAANHIKNFVYPADAYGPADVALAPDGTLWVAGHGTIERFTTTGVATSIQVGAPGTGPFGIAVDTRGRLWFAMEHAVGLIKVEGQKTAVLIQDAGPDSAPEGIVADAKGTAWVTDMHGAILRVSEGEPMRRYKMQSGDAEPFGITIGPDGAVWFTEFFNQSIGRLDPSSGAILEYHLRAPHGFPTSIVSATGALWFLDLAGFLGRISTRGEVTELVVPTPAPVRANL